MFQHGGVDNFKFANFPFERGEILFSKGFFDFRIFVNYKGAANQDNFLFKTADAFCMMENMVLQATELEIASCIVSRGYETFGSEVGQKLMREWEVPASYACQGV